MTARFEDIGRRGRALAGDDSLHAEGTIVAYCEAPTVVMDVGAARISWRADRVIVLRDSDEATSPQRERVARALFEHLVDNSRSTWPAPVQHLPWWYAAADAAIAAYEEGREA